jgi:hypothetical protein
MLNDWREDQDFALKQRATEALTTTFEAIPKTDGMELLRAGFVSRLAAVCQAMEGLAGVTGTAIPSWSGGIPWDGESRELVERLYRPGLVGGLLNIERRIGDDFDDETVGRAIIRWERLVSDLG